jgi:hypothetical protein
MNKKRFYDQKVNGFDNYKNNFFLLGDLMARNFTLKVDK